VVGQFHTPRRISRLLLLGVLALLSAAACVSLVRAWRAERTAQLTCSLQVESLPPLRYVEIQLKKQHPIEPTFSGILFAQVQNSGHKNPVELKVTRSAVRTYAQSDTSCL